jgi:hypothetical protein
MAAILELEQSLDAVLSEAGPSSHAEALDATLSSYIGLGDSDSDADGEADTDSEGMPVDGVTGDKRKLFVQCETSLFNANALLTETVSSTPASVSAPVSRRLKRHTPSNSGGTPNHPTPSSPTPSRLSLPSPLPARHLRPPPHHLDKKNNSPAALQHQSGGRSAHENLFNRARARCWR